MQEKTPPNPPAFIGFDAPIGAHVGRAFSIAFLNLMTVGLYKPYGITHTRRFLYAHTFIKGVPLAYHGTATTLSRFTFYPSAVFLFLLLVPGILQFFVSLEAIIALSVIQAILLVVYAHFLVFYNKKYELSNISWNGKFLTLNGSSLTYATKSLASLALTALTLGLAAPWRRVMLSNMIYNNLFISSHPVESTLTTRPLWSSYLFGWALSLSGLLFSFWYYWQYGILPVQNLLNGGKPDLTMAASINPSSFGDAMGGMGGTISQETLAEMGTWLNAITLLFVLYPFWVIWKKLCLSIYEATFQTLWAQNTRCAGASLHFSGTPFGIFARDSLCFLANFTTANLSRPFTTYIKQRYACRSFLIMTPNALIAAILPVTPPKEPNEKIGEKATS